MEDFLRIAGDYLRCGEKEEAHTSAKRDMDFNADEKYIAASFMSDYQIDLSKTDMHFWQYIHLVQGFTERSVMSRVREIRNYDLDELKDPKTRAKMVKAKEAVALPEKFSKAEQSVIDEFEKLFEVG
jgi:nitric oxide reductase large subunit